MMNVLNGTGRGGRTVLAALAVAALLAPALSRPVAAQTPAMNGFAPNSDYLLEVNGTQQKAEIFHSEREAAYLIVSSALPGPVLLRAGTGRAEGVHVMKVSKQANGSVNLLSGAVTEAYGNFQLNGDKLGFNAGPTQAYLVPNPPLVGSHPADELFDHSPSYRYLANAYTPDADALASLAKAGGKVKVKAFFGSWCPFCKRHLPNLMKVEQALAESGIEFEYYGLPRGFKGNPEAEKAKVTGVPTGIIYVDGKEVGRLNGNAWRRPELTLSTILK